MAPGTGAFRRGCLISLSPRLLSIGRARQSAALPASPAWTFLSGLMDSIISYPLVLWLSWSAYRLPEADLGGSRVPSCPPSQPVPITRHFPALHRSCQRFRAETIDCCFCPLGQPTI
ncbi:hypothetical protein BO78DRAFT_395747 [Aspergillus sclerotiicarbonarius CBS 121057]|uniref:Uncharacterized protein n=1 Tax=Aspergillus sclerotiicarbonarius (strain CBS 121057 / IBT 28362) TaxID=1448318 RepID=A0A319ENP0_ASPSB|nr:hypothetical protein BO78DRAFT_395747 [Aspergillus sclerotiicarbonarius CBS 121057]